MSNTIIGKDGNLRDFTFPKRNWFGKPEFVNTHEYVLQRLAQDATLVNPLPETKVKVSALTNETFVKIKQVVDALIEANPVFMSFFKVAEEIEVTNETAASSTITKVMLKNSKPFHVDMQKGRKYIIEVPSNVVIDSIEYFKTFNRNPRAPRDPFTNLVMDCHVDNFDVDLIFIITGLVTENVQIVKPTQYTIEVPESDDQEENSQNNQENNTETEN